MDKKSHLDQGRRESGCFFSRFRAGASHLDHNLAALSEVKLDPKKKNRTKADLPQENQRKQLSRGSRVFGNQVWCVCVCVSVLLVSSVTVHPSDQRPELHQLRSACV